jgi:hypothetical protein
LYNDHIIFWFWITSYLYFCFIYFLFFCFVIYFIYSNLGISLLMSDMGLFKLTIQITAVYGCDFVNFILELVFLLFHTPIPILLLMQLV